MMLVVSSYDVGKTAPDVSRPWMLWVAIQERPNVFKLADVKPACLNQREPVGSQLSLLVRSRIGGTH